MPDEDLSFLETDDPESLPPDGRNKYLDYWFARTPEERLGEAMRLNIAKWGEEVFKKGMDKSHFEVINMSKYGKR